MIPFAALWLLCTISLIATAPRMDAVMWWIADSLYSAVTLYGWLYWNVRLATKK